MIVPLGAAILALALAACGGGGSAPVESSGAAPAPSSAAPSDSAAASTDGPIPIDPTVNPSDSGVPRPTQAAGAPDSCALITADQVKAINGVGGSPAKAGSVVNESLMVDGCNFGQFDNGIVSVIVTSPATGMNAVSPSLAVAKNVVDVPSVPGGKGYDIGILLGGGGLGYSVSAVAGDYLVVVSLLSDKPVTQAQKDALAAAAAGAAQAL